MTTNDSTNPTLGRRNVLRLFGGAVVTGSALGSVAETAQAQASGANLDSWFEKTSNYDGIVDKTGSSSVTVTVGSQANNGAFGFGPAAVRVDPGTTVVWEWTGKGGVHDVTADDGSFGSELVGDAGHTFEHTFDSEGVYKYVCSPHAALGMKGAIVVGNAAAGSAATTQSSEETEQEETEETAEQSSGEDVDLNTWFENTSNFDGVEGQTGLKRVTVEVGTQANDGAFGFGPAAIRVSKGTTVVWKWTGNGGSHNVAATDGSFKSELVSDSGHTFEHTFDETGTYRYACTPHETLGMKGAVVVSDDEGGSNAQVAEPFDDPETERLGGLALAGTFGAAITSPALFGAFLWFKDRGNDGESYPKQKSE
ncbi:halocyanin domain-containing protein [Haloferax mediterranei ATCC 33500]|uniref:Halocyanin n=1 Tax=Haloferax mediterranei (strain ATCC 33500 / DSM 1411 / JCM 8866 / NBRC 14739 / NCIMB 2177 / R-4) TaxID=523841 RepID=I3R6L9_HALMT|nr:halocyanin domain-containing protein [Haloferax mediterranei]AFK19879.1 halocyanin precursor-like protein [Haloferax mediterranei ATCC 33500]AHZ23258.1 halocyanin [Haloferax mediterranei ATCC 33500]ELZ99423.1 halocyanin precursor-like protein [Haloferax mediterranei ATCC 33500]MDX5987372.1 halocyanin domain-containing protein [Haloferax mediterranei ATCC 33500]QCQ73880.1 halocyanin domain-containing protein [Haloferax mediterranei ATCC 33500]